MVPPSWMLTGSPSPVRLRRLPRRRVRSSAPPLDPPSPSPNPSCRVRSPPSAIASTPTFVVTGRHRLGALASRGLAPAFRRAGARPSQEATAGAGARNRENARRRRQRRTPLFAGARRASGTGATATKHCSLRAFRSSSRVAQTPRVGAVASSCRSNGSSRAAARKRLKRSRRPGTRRPSRGA